MKTSRYSTSRQKACMSCSNAKTKCDRKAGGCLRCVLRGQPCIYPQTEHSTDASDSQTSLSLRQTGLHEYTSDSVAAGAQAVVLSPGLALSLPSPTAASSTAFSLSQTSPQVQEDVEHEEEEERQSLSFAQLDLVCPIDADGVSMRWMHSFIPLPGQTIKAYPPATMVFVRRLLQSYASRVVRGRDVPPFVHAAQTAAPAARRPLATCLNLVRLFDASPLQMPPLPGSRDAAVEVLLREMDWLSARDGDVTHDDGDGDGNGNGDDDLSGLASFQAYLLYAMVLFFFVGHVDTLRPAVMALQQLACASARRGLVCRAEQQRGRPVWEAWIVAEAKRRTLYTMYLFDSVLAAHDGLPTFLGTELRGLLAPGSRCLWQAESRTVWETAYNVHLVDWPEEGGLRIDELWPVPPELSKTDVARRHDRVGRWLEGLDEFGTAIYAVTSCTHGV